MAAERYLQAFRTAPAPRIPPSPRLGWAGPARSDGAQAHAPGRLRAAAGLLAAALTLSGCGPEGGSTARAQELDTGPILERLIELSTDLDPTLTSDHHDRHLHARRAYVAELRKAPRDVGLAALETFQEVEARAEPAPILVRINLLDVAAHSATEETVPLLETLLLEYGHRIDIRTEAALLLGQVAPARAVELITPLLEKTKATSTMPADEFLLKAYLTGCAGTGTDPVPVLADVATNIYKQEAARHQAVQALGEHPTLLSRQALRSLLVESTGNDYLRIKAAQAIRKAYSREEACAIFEEIASREASNNFLAFLADMMQENCE
jgi:hypothetical protein